MTSSMTTKRLPPPETESKIEIIFNPPIVFNDDTNTNKININFQAKFNKLQHENINVKNEIQNEWNRRKATNPNLFDGSKFRYHSVIKSDESNVATINLGLTSYGEFLGTNYNQKIANKLKLDGMEKHNNEQIYMADPVGVGAMVSTTDDYIIAFQRSETVGEFPGYLDVPGGHPEPKEVGLDLNYLNTEGTTNKIKFTIVQDKGIDENYIKREEEEEDNSTTTTATTNNIKEQIVTMKSLLNELFNSITMEVNLEINIPLKHLTPPKLIGIFRQTGTPNGRGSICFAMECNLSSNEVKEYFAFGPQEKDESTGELIFIPKKDVLSGAYNSNNGQDGKYKFTPASNACCYMYSEIYGGM